MIHRGALISTEDGFEIYLRDLVERDINISEAEAAGMLSSRQRFALAHEVAHVWFHMHSKELPRRRAYEDVKSVEETCDGAAERILVPTRALKKYIDETLGDVERIDAAFLHSATKLFRTSPRVMIEALRRVEATNMFDRCIMFFTTSNGQPEIATWYCGAPMLRTLPLPKRPYHPLSEWLKRVLSSLAEAGDGRELRVKAIDREVVLKKVAWRSGRDFSIQIDGIPSLLP